MNVTAESLIHSSDLRRKAVAEIHVRFVELGAQVLTEEEVRKFGRRKHTNGWRINLGDNTACLCTVLTDVDFPWTPVSVYADPLLYRIIPHVEQDGWVCTLPAQATFDAFNALGVTKIVLNQAQNILSAAQNEEEHKDEFEREFLSYWNADVRRPNVRSLTSLTGSSREAIVWRGTEFTLVADNEKHIYRWLCHRNGLEIKSAKSIYSTETGVILQLKGTPLPSEFPTNATQVLALARHCGDGAVQLLKQAVVDRRASLLVLLIGTTPNGPAPFAVDLAPVPNLSRGPSKIPVDGLTAGFRAQHMTEAAAAKRVFVNRNTVQRKVDRIDPSWVHGRDFVAGIGDLQNRHVIMLGCGSVGSSVASQLAKSGVGKLSLVDPELLVPANASRHELGIDAVGGFKSELLRTRLLRQFPHMREIKHYPHTWQHVVSRNENIFAEADVIVSTIGNWEAEGSLNHHWLRMGRITPLIVGWAEPFAGAGHAVMLGTGSGCLSCHFEYSGKAELRVTQWPAGTLQQEPACGAMFQPYGAIEIGHVHSLISRATIDVLTHNIRDEHRHRIWCAQHNQIVQNGGDWTKEWSHLHPNMQNGGFLWERNWKPRFDCSHCSDKA